MVVGTLLCHHTRDSAPRAQITSDSGSHSASAAPGLVAYNYDMGINDQRPHLTTKRRKKTLPKKSVVYRCSLQEIPLKLS
jgi:hypothetical protein